MISTLRTGSTALALGLHFFADVLRNSLEAFDVEKRFDTDGIDNLGFDRFGLPRFDVVSALSGALANDIAAESSYVGQ